MNIKEDFLYIELKIRKEDNYFYELFYYYKYRITNYIFLFVFESNEFTICINFLICFAIQFKCAIEI